MGIRKQDRLDALAALDFMWPDPVPVTKAWSDEARAAAALARQHAMHLNEHLGGKFSSPGEVHSAKPGKEQPASMVIHPGAGDKTMGSRTMAAAVSHLQGRGFSKTPGGGSVQRMDHPDGTRAVIHPAGQTHFSPKE